MEKKKKMKTGLGLYRKCRMIYAYVNLFRFGFRKNLLGFDVANQFIQRTDKISIQLILKKNGAKIGGNCDIESGLTFHNCSDYSNLIIGNNCHVGKNCFFDLRDKVVIEDNVVVSMQCSFITHIDISKSSLSEIFPQKQMPIELKSNCYIGARSTILMGIIIGRDGFVASGATVTEDVPLNTMVGGIPAKIIKKLKD